MDFAASSGSLTMGRGPEEGIEVLSTHSPDAATAPMTDEGSEELASTEVVCFLTDLGTLLGVGVVPCSDKAVLLDGVGLTFCGAFFLTLGVLRVFTTDT